jgi:uncharacterized protein
LDEEWYPFLKEHHFLVGVSLDGDNALHDRWRKDKAGAGTFQRVLDTIQKLEHHGISYNILTVVTGTSAKKAERIYRFFKENNLGFQQYIECLDPLNEKPGQCPWSLTPEKYGYFLKSLFDCWYQDRKKGVYVYNRYFENLLSMLRGQQPESCNMRGSCGLQWVVEADGGVYPCDFYVLDEWKLGNIKDCSFKELEAKRKELEFIEKSRSIPEKCGNCPWFYLCRNGCRRNCFMTSDGQRDVNYFCESYREFFTYAVPRLKELASL